MVDRRRRMLLRSLPAVLLLLVALVAAPQRAGAGSRPVACAAIVPEVSADKPDAGTQVVADAEAAPADRGAVLRAQFIAGVRGSRAPPAGSV